MDSPRIARLQPRIQLDGDVAVQRKAFAEAIGCSEKTVQRMNLPTLYVANVAYVLEGAAQRDIAQRAKRRNKPPQRRGKRST